MTGRQEDDPEGNPDHPEGNPDHPECNPDDPDDSECSPDDPEDDEEWTTGDFTVTTSDSIRFHIPSAYLFASSPVWESARELSTTNSLSFTDPDIETSTVFRLFLGLMEDGELPYLEGDCNNMGNPIILGNLVRFLQKWECTPSLRFTLLHIRDQLRCRPATGFLAFWVGAIASDVETCELALSMGFRLRWFESSADVNCDKPRFGCSVWDLNGWDRASRRDMPELYAWALGRAFLAVGATKRLSAKFAYYLAKAETKVEIDVECWKPVEEKKAL